MCDALIRDSPLVGDAYIARLLNLVFLLRAMPPRSPAIGQRATCEWPSWSLAMTSHLRSSVLGLSFGLLALTGLTGCIRETIVFPVKPEAPLPSPASVLRSGEI